MEQISKRLMNWASILDDGAREQAERTSRMPFIFPHLALMPDAHWGMGATVGSVIPTLGAIMPAAIGVDIGCGMMAIQTDVRFEDYAGAVDLNKLRESIERVVPLSAGEYNTKLWDSDITGARTRVLKDMAEARGFDPKSYAGNWEMQLGSLGSGNHFIEICKDEDDLIWLFLHSGSRGVGNKIAMHHIKVAKALMERYYIDLEDPDLAYLVQDTPEFWTYIKQMQWAQEFALFNRQEMMDRVWREFCYYIKPHDVQRLKMINCHHNYTQQEHHFGKDVWLSRKGAIDASEGAWGLIPGSMGDLSYVVQGKGNALGLNSSPHGAGRARSRNASKAMFDLADLEKRMEGVSWNVSDTFLDEHPLAYKPIDEVMKDADDLVEIRHTLKQFVNVKGASGIKRRGK